MIANASKRLTSIFADKILLTSQHRLSPLDKALLKPPDQFPHFLIPSPENLQTGQSLKRRSSNSWSIFFSLSTSLAIEASIISQHRKNCLFMESGTRSLRGRRWLSSHGSVTDSGGISWLLDTTLLRWIYSEWFSLKGLILSSELIKDVKYKYHTNNSSGPLRSILASTMLTLFYSWTGSRSSWRDRTHVQSYQRSRTT